MAVLGDDQAAVAVIAVAVGDVAGQGEREGVPVQVVGVGDDELGDRGEVTLDGVEVAGVGRRGDGSMLWAAATCGCPASSWRERLSWIQ